MNKQKLKNYVLSNPREFLEDQGVIVKSDKGGQVTGHCPFHHDRNPSFIFSKSNGLWNCFAGCGGGDLFSLYARIHGLDASTQFREILEQLSDELGGVL